MTDWNQKQLLGKFRDNARSIESVTGSTINASVNVIDLDVRQNRDTVIIVENTGVNTLYYSVQIRNEYTIGTNFTAFTNEVVPDDSDEVILCKHARVFVNVQSHIMGLQTDYKVGIIGST